jgi:hypothetical protein
MEIIVDKWLKNVATQGLSGIMEGKNPEEKFLHTVHLHI